MTGSNVSEALSLSLYVNETSDPEVAALRRQQARDDVQRQPAERLGNQRTRSLEGLEASYVEPGFAAIEDELSDEPRIISHTEAQLATVRKVVAGLSAFEQEVYYHLFGQGLSERETAAAMRENDTKIHRTIVRVKERVALALADTGGGEEHESA